MSRYIHDEEYAEAEELCSYILDVWYDCDFAQSISKKIDAQEPLTKNQLAALESIWDGISDERKKEAGY